jgi:predicted DNA-binding transcriptional regulator YafY
MRGRRGPVTAFQLAQSLDVSERTIYRDLAELAAQGAPIEGEAGVGYILRPGLFRRNRNHRAERTGSGCGRSPV